MVSKASVVYSLIVLVAVANAYDFTYCPSNSGLQKHLVYANRLGGVSINVHIPPSQSGYFNKPITCIQIMDELATSVYPQIVEGGYLDTYVDLNITSLNGQEIIYNVLVYID
ncbi:uncharacterized protein [Diabrotica undecimpunctata]|uniref:uncharacterized protein isoform X2 n=1 Tax=Diabrotica undecimpunctata TaxID=50387 RepID=UPI003B63439F